jgi:putative toxin-antitoxin system antitoxin component (TIGR02293 family)
MMVNELTAIVGELGGEATVGRPIRSGEDMSEAIREGFPQSVVDALIGASGLTLQEVASSLDLSTRSLQRRKHQGRLARYESDRLYRLARLLALADYFIGSREKAVEWMKRPNLVLGGVAPLKLLDTELGARQVENILGRIGYGGVS